MSRFQHTLPGINKRCTTILIMAIHLSFSASGYAEYQTTVIEGVPHVKQKPDFCGEACAEMYLSKLGHKITQDDFFNLSGVKPIDGRGCYTKEMGQTLTTIGFKVGKIWNRIPAGSSEQMHAQWRALHADLLKSIPSIVCMYYDDSKDSTEHFRLILGYDSKTKEVIFNEPALDKAGYQRMKLDYFLKCWPLKYSKEQWTVIRLRLEPDKIKKSKSYTGLTDADYAQHMMKLKTRIPSAKFSVYLEKPFFVLGDESARTVKNRKNGTVKWAVSRLKNMYFSSDPKEIQDIWMFKDRTSYLKYAWEIFGDRPDTPYGYASSEHNALIMNIRTGGGTLVHEIVHPFVAANFPECPSWLNEGLGSLYEQSDGSGTNLIIGLTNWRLAGLQQAISAKTVPSFKRLTSTSEYEFYQKDPGTNYSQARYLCYYLQQKGLLTKFYHKFVKSKKTDPTGYKTLAEVLGENDMPAFKKKWEQYVMALTFP